MTPPSGVGQGSGGAQRNKGRPKTTKKRDPKTNKAKRSDPGESIEQTAINEAGFRGIWEESEAESGGGNLRGPDEPVPGTTDEWNPREYGEEELGGDELLAKGYPFDVDSELRWDLIDREGQGWDGEHREPDLILREVGHMWTAYLVRPLVVDGASYRNGKKRLHRMEKRDQQLQKLGEIIGRHQSRYLESFDPRDLKPLRVNDLENQLRASSGKGGTANRFLKRATVQLPDASVVALRDLVPEITVVKLRLIKAALKQHDAVQRGGDGSVTVNYVASVECIANTVREMLETLGEYNAGTTSDTIGKQMRKNGIPSDPKKRRKTYEEGRDTWSV